ncbi:DUF4349 domain-containing protein [Sphingosinicella sp. YJ22]|uniref:DUF4349 domain-containing protein n=1 Tax=Sphingosinicella sp. YJ22 TaxID=1104780 RepID=UPI001407986F|nr:DUF4349 domain-containing protein [Sphingosinicella sp. YJ22]
MRRFLVTTGLVLVLAGCGVEQGERGGRGEGGSAANDAATTDANFESPPALVAPPSPTSPNRSSVPEVRPDAAPDVAFGYSYNFGIAADRIAGVQQRHARTCEELGTSRCRITGMTYRRSGGDSVEAQLRLALDPSLADRFGENALAAVQEAEGELVDSEITSTDVGTGIRRDTRSIADLHEELRTIEQRITAVGTRDEAKAGLQEQAAELRRQISALEDNRAEQRDQLATTPVTLAYSSSAYNAGRPDFGGAAGNAWDQLVWATYMLFVLLSVLLPWLLAAGLIWLVVRAVRKRMPKPASEPAA